MVHTICYCRRARAGYAREVTFETPKQGKDFNDPSESTEEDDSRTVDRTSKRIAIPTEAHWRGKGSISWTQVYCLTRSPSIDDYLCR